MTHLHLTASDGRGRQVEVSGELACGTLWRAPLSGARGLPQFRPAAAFEEREASLPTQTRHTVLRWSNDRLNPHQ